jgi:hypothetical protein
MPPPTAPVGSHDDQVVKRINKYIDKVNSQFSKENAATKLEADQKQLESTVTITLP